MSNELRLKAQAVLARYDEDGGVIDVHTDFELMEALRDELAKPQPKSQLREDFLVRTEKELEMLEKHGGGHELGFTQRLLRDYKHALPNLMTVDDVITHLEDTGYLVVEAKKWHSLQDKHETVLNDDTHDAFELKPIPDYVHVFTAEEFENEDESGNLNSDDGLGYWATELGESRLGVWSVHRPEWATHVTWYNK